MSLVAALLGVRRGAVVLSESEAEPNSPEVIDLAILTQGGSGAAYFSGAARTFQ